MTENNFPWWHTNASKTTATDVVRERAEEVVLIVGPRFQLNEEDFLNFEGLVRAGTDKSAVVDRVPISGPIFRVTVHTQAGTVYRAECIGCGNRSNLYKNAYTTMLFQWSHDHRCPPVRWRLLQPAS